MWIANLDRKNNQYRSSIQERKERISYCQKKKNLYNTQCLDNSFASVHDLNGRNVYVPGIR